MVKTNVKIGKRGGVYRVAEQLKRIRNASVSKDVFEIVDRCNEKGKIRLVGKGS